MIKTVFFDIDGTLVSHTKNQVSESTRNALQLLRGKGIQRFIATGRHISEIDSLPMDGLEFDGYFMLNGQLCYNAHKELLSGNPLEGTSKNTLIDLFNSMAFPIMFIEADRMYINFINDRVRLAQESMSAWIPEISPYQEGIIYQAVAFVTPEEKSILLNRLPDCRIAQWMKYAVDIVPEKSGKAAAIAKYLSNNGLSADEIMAFGDGNNDIDMLKYAGLGVAMGNADDSVKQAADYITDHIDEDGIYNALVHFNII